MPQPLWTIVLAGGAGRRLASVTDGVPKQFWHYDGRRSLLEATLDRVAPLSPPDRTVIVVDKSHRRFLGNASAMSDYCRVVYQPAERGTAAGVLLGLIEVLESAPEAIVLLTPSDHGVAQPARFRAGILEAVAHVQTGKSDIVLFGAEPTAADCEYGWITSEQTSRSGHFRRVARFAEKPAADEAARLFRSGAVWNTMVLVATASALFDLYWTHLPSLASVFAHALHLPRAAREGFLARAYPSMMPADFSHQVIAPSSELSLFVWPATMHWSDLGTPARFRRWMEREAVRHSERPPRVRHLIEPTRAALQVA